MRKDLTNLRPIKSSFLSFEKDTETILRKLFIENYPHSQELIKLLAINTKDCLDEDKSEVYNNIVKEMTIAKLREDGYIQLAPRLKFTEHEEIKSYMLISFDNFTPNATNPQFRDCIVNFDIICHTDYWDLGNYRLRPLKILGYIDGILDGCKLSGIGTFQFIGANLLILNEELSGYSLMYQAVHGSDDYIENETE